MAICEASSAASRQDQHERVQPTPLQDVTNVPEARGAKPKAALRPGAHPVAVLEHTIATAASLAACDDPNTVLQHCGRLGECSYEEIQLWRAGSLIKGEPETNELCTIVKACPCRGRMYTYGILR